MPNSDSAAQTPIATLEHEGRLCSVTCRVSFDGIEYLGRLWFADEEQEHAAIPDRAPIPGRTRDEVIALARRLSIQELELRHRRALAEKRRFFKLRRATEEILVKIRYLNQLAVSAREGWIDEEGANQEIELTEKQLHEAVDRLRYLAGVEG
jgi:hypothetical protein